MKKITKSRLIALAWILGILLIVTCVTMHFYNEFQRLNYSMSSHEVKDFSKYKKSFEIVAKKSLELFDEEKKNNDEIKRITIYGTTNNNWRLICRTDKDEIYEISKEVSKEEMEAINQVSVAIGSASYSTDMSWIRVFEDRVIFATTRPYAIIYMDNWRRPDYFYNENDTSDFYTERLAPRWYQVVAK